MREKPDTVTDKPKVDVKPNMTCLAMNGNRYSYRP